MSTVDGALRQPPKVTVFHVAWMIVLAISTAANIKFCMSLAGDSTGEQGLWLALGLAIEIMVAVLPFKLREQWFGRSWSMLFPTSLMFAIAAGASLYAGLSFASMVREGDVARKSNAVEMRQQLASLRAKPTVAEIRPRLDLLLSDRKLGGCKVVRSNYGRRKCGEVANLKSQIATSRRNQQTIQQLESQLAGYTTIDKPVSKATVDPGSTYVVGWAARVGYKINESDVRQIMTTALVILIWLGVMFGGVIANPYEAEKKPVRLSREPEAVSKPDEDNDNRPQKPSSGTKAKVATVPNTGKRTKTESKVLTALGRSAGNVVEGSKSAVARTFKISRNTLDGVLAKLDEAGDISHAFDGSNLRVALA